MRLWDCLSLLEIMSAWGSSISSEDGKRLKEARKRYQNEEKIHFLFYMYADTLYQRVFMQKIQKACIGFKELTILLSEKKFDSAKVIKFDSKFLHI